VKKIHTSEETARVGSKCRATCVGEVVKLTTADHFSLAFYGQREATVCPGQQSSSEEDQMSNHTLASVAGPYLASARADRQKPSTIKGKESILRTHLLPRFGDLPIDELDHTSFETVKSALADKAAKSVNNVLTVFRSCLAWAHAQGFRTTPPPKKAGWVRTSKTRVKVWTPEQYETLVREAREIGPDTLVMILLGGDAGLRPGEVRALPWSSVDVRKKLIHVELTEWGGQVNAPKGNEVRTVPMTGRLLAALKSLPGKRRGLVLPRNENTLHTPKSQRCAIKRAQKMADLETYGPHTLRHTFCSTLAERGASVTAIQQLAGHKDLATTQRYMHAHAGALASTIALIERET
jgi:integrase